MDPDSNTPQFKLVMMQNKYPNIFTDTNVYYNPSYVVGKTYPPDTDIDKLKADWHPMFEEPNLVRIRMTEWDDNGKPLTCGNKRDIDDNLCDQSDKKPKLDDKN